MKEELLKELLSYMSATKDFVLEQSPEIFAQIVRYTIASSCLELLISLLLLSGAVFVFRRVGKKPNDEGMEEVCFAMFLLAAVVGIGSFIGLCCATHNLLLALCAPKYLILKLLVGK